MPNIGLVALKDAETQEIKYVDTSNNSLRENFAKNQKAKHVELKKLFKSTGTDYIDILTGEDYVGTLIKFFKKRGKRK